MYDGLFPSERPVGLRRRSVPAGTGLWRIDGSHPAAWSWAGFPAPRSRFDPASGAFRTRYAGSSVAGAGRERYLSSGRLVPADHAGHHLVHLVANRPLRVLDLRTQANLDVLAVDDRVNTGREPQVWTTCNRLADAARHWWDELDGIVYRSRTTPQESVNFAFFSLDGLDLEDSRELRACPDELDGLVLHDRFTIGFPY